MMSKHYNKGKTQFATREAAGKCALVSDREELSVGGDVKRASSKGPGRARATPAADKAPLEKMEKRGWRQAELELNKTV